MNCALNPPCGRWSGKEVIYLLGNLFGQIKLFPLWDQGGNLLNQNSLLQKSETGEFSVIGHSGNGWTPRDRWKTRYFLQCWRTFQLFMPLAWLTWNRVICMLIIMAVLIQTEIKIRVTHPANYPVQLSSSVCPWKKILEKQMVDNSLRIIQRWNQKSILEQSTRFVDAFTPTTVKKYQPCK